LGIGRSLPDVGLRSIAALLASLQDDEAMDVYANR